MNLDSTISTIILDSLSLEDLQVMVERKRQLPVNSFHPKKLTEVQKTKNYCRELLLKKLNPPKFR